jgi:hypothetical protein
MTERRLRCTSKTCISLAVRVGRAKPKCSKVWKVWQCSSSHRWVVLTTPTQHARGDMDCRATHRAVVTAAMKKYIKDMDETGLAPRHIWSGMRRCAAAPPLNGQPSYPQVVRCVKYQRTKSGERNSIDAIKALVREYALQSGIDEDKAFMFGPTLDDGGFPWVGSGNDDDSFVMGVTTVRLLQKVKHFNQDNVFSLFHIDATFKLSEIGYPVITCGFSDSSRKYHLAAMFVVSRLTQLEYAGVLTALLQVYQRLFQSQPKIDAVLSDAEDAQYNGLQATAHFKDAKFLMCFFHVLYNVRKRTRQLEDRAGAVIYEGVVAMHFPRSLLEFYEVRDKVLAHWR